MTFRASEGLKEQLEALSKKQARPVSEIVRESVVHYIRIQQFRALRGKTLPFAEAQGLLTDEDIFEAIS